MEFPALNTKGLSQVAVDQESLKRIKALWDEHSAKWPDGIQQTIIENLKHVRWTKSNSTQPSGHRIWKDLDWDFAVWVLMTNQPLKKRRVASAVPDNRRTASTTQAPPTDHQRQDLQDNIDITDDDSLTGEDSHHGQAQAGGEGAVGHGPVAPPAQVERHRPRFKISRGNVLTRENAQRARSNSRGANRGEQSAVQQPPVHHQPVYQASSFDEPFRLPPTHAQGVGSIEQPVYHQSSVHSQAQASFFDGAPRSIPSTSTGAHSLPSQSQALPQRSDSYHHGSDHQFDQSLSPYSTKANPMNVNAMINQPDQSVYDLPSSSSLRSQSHQSSPLASHTYWID
ncbi:hypothetical protein LRP88_14129 [Fusarium phalaenopsidis]